MLVLLLVLVLVLERRRIFEDEEEDDYEHEPEPCTGATFNLTREKETRNSGLSFRVRLPLACLSYPRRFVKN